MIKKNNLNDLEIMVDDLWIMLKDYEVAVDLYFSKKRLIYIYNNIEKFLIKT